MKLLFLLLELAFIKSALLYRVYHSLPAHEIKRRARAKDKRYTALYKVAAYIDTLDVTVWLVGAAAGTTIFIWAARTDWWLALIAVLAADILMRRPGLFTADNWAGGFAAWFAPYHAKALSFLQPVLGRAARWLPASPSHSGLFETKDLLDLTGRQLKQADNRIPESDLRIARGAMTFGDKLVSSVMTPRRQIKFVAAGENVGPLLMDELHQSGHSRFPVIKDSTQAKSASPQVVGTLYLNDLVGYEGQGKVKELARRQVYFINEDSNLRQALSAFLKTHHHLLIAVNSFEEVVGVLSVEDVLEQIIGQPIIDEFDNYDDLRAVAAKEAKQEEESHEEIQPEDKNHNETPVAPESE